MVEQAPKSRWFQFSLASLFWLMLVIAVSIYGFREHQERLALDAEVADLKVEVQWWKDANKLPGQAFITGVSPGTSKLLEDRSKKSLKP